MNPICCKCQIEMQVLQNGVVLVAMGEPGPMEIRRCDSHRCKTCGAVVIAPSSVSARPEAMHFDDRFAELLQRYDSDPLQTVIRYWHDARAKERAEDRTTVVIENVTPPLDSVYIQPDNDNGQR